MDDQAADTRAGEILDRIKAIFAAKGFDGASMQDLARAAGMSAGNFYRYFPSKSAIVEAIVEREVGRVRAKFAEVIDAPDPRAAFRGLVRQRIETAGEMDGPIWIEIEACAARRPELAGVLVRMEAEIVGSLVAIFGRIAGVPRSEAAARFSAHARLIVTLVQGVSVRCGGCAGRAPAAPDRDLTALVVRMIEHILAEIDAASLAEPR